MNDPLKHHFLPVFYLKRWCASNDRVIEFSTPYKQEVKYRHVHPSGTGYINRLYAVEGLPGELSIEIEKSFLSPVDSRAALALEALTNGAVVSDEHRIAWSAFMMTLLIRMPTEIEALKKVAQNISRQLPAPIFKMLTRHAPKELHSDIEEAFLETEKTFLSRAVASIEKMLKSEDIASRILEMEWATLDLSGSPHELLTSDKPVIVAKLGGADTNTLFSLALGPRKLFVAATEQRFITELRKTNPKKLVEAFNTEIVTGARRFVYGRTTQQISFIQKRFGTNRMPSIVENVLSSAITDIGSVASYLSTFEDDEMRRKIEEAYLLGKN